MTSTARRGIGGVTMAGMSYVKGRSLSKVKPAVLCGVVRPDGVT